MAQALYRQYRSKSFDELVGQEHITDLLAEAVRRGAISHAYLFTGPKGVGKTSVARILAHAINDLPYKDDSIHLDIIEIDAASNRRIDDIRELREKVHIAPTSAKYKVYIVDEVHMLTGESFNALLKTLEEPPQHVVFILATTELHKVPATIVSRTQRFHFRPGSIEAISKHLKMIAQKEKIDIADDAIKLIASHGDGSFRDSVSLLDQVSNLGSATITPQLVESLLGLAPHEQVEAIIDSIVASDTTKTVLALQTLVDDGIGASSIVAQLMTQLPDHAKDNPRLYDLLGDLVDVPRSYAPAMKLLAVVARYSEPAVKTNNTEPRAPAKPPTVAPTNEAKIDIPTPPPVQPSPTNSDYSWPNILSEVQKHDKALYSVLRRAEAQLDDQTLTLSFAYALHRKKMQASKYSSQLSKIIHDIFAQSPEIIINGDSASKLLDATAASVADIMGGGEAVNPIEAVEKL